MVEQVLVFISHTQEMSQQPKGESYVDGAEDAINAIDGAKARHMEFFPAADMSPAEYSIHQLENADIFLAVVGFQRGSTVPGEERSYTELEFDAATELAKERLLFLLHPSAPGASQADSQQIQFRQKLERSGATVAYFNDVGDLKYKVSQAVIRSIRERTRKGPSPNVARTPRLPPVEGRTVAKTLSFVGFLGVILFLLVVLGIWTAFAGAFPPWSSPGECSNVTAAVTDASPTTFGPFTSGAALDIVVENRSSNTISVPAGNDVIARGATGMQYAPETSLASVMVLRDRDTGRLDSKGPVGSRRNARWQERRCDRGDTRDPRIRLVSEPLSGNGGPGECDLRRLSRSRRGEVTRIGIDLILPNRIVTKQCVHRIATGADKDLSGTTREEEREGRLPSDAMKLP